MGDIQFKPKGWSIDQLARLVEHMPDLRVKLMGEGIVIKIPLEFKNGLISEKWVKRTNAILSAINKAAEDFDKEEIEKRLKKDNDGTPNQEK